MNFLIVLIFSLSFIFFNQKEVTNILVIGDSNSAASNSWVNILQKSNANCHFLNLSIAGNTIAFDNGGRDTLNTQKNIKSYLKRAETEIGAVNKIILMLGSNDFKAVFDSFSNSIPENLEYLIKTIKTLSKAQIIVVSPPPMAEDSLLDAKYYGGARKIRKFVSEFSDRAKSNNIIYVNLHDSLAPQFKNLNIDGVHLNETGQQITAKIIQQALIKYL
jgi:lysophospholipase L1-like esterase